MTECVLTAGEDSEIPGTSSEAFVVDLDLELTATFLVLVDEWDFGLKLPS